MATYTEIYDLLQSDPIQNKVRAAVIDAGIAIANENPETVNHAGRLAWANSALNDPNGTAAKVARYVILANKALTAQQITDLSDSDIFNHVAASIAIFAAAE